MLQMRLTNLPDMVAPAGGARPLSGLIYSVVLKLITSKSRNIENSSIDWNESADLVALM